LATTKLAGDLAEFSLGDLLQVHGLAGRTCCVKILTPAGKGMLYLANGSALHAAYEDLSGKDALAAMVAASSGFFQVENGATTAERTLQGPMLGQLIDANARIEAGKVPVPRRLAPESPAEPGTAPGETAPALLDARTAAAGGRPGRRAVLSALIVVATLAVGFVAFLRRSSLELGAAPRRGEAVSSAAAAAAADGSARVGARLAGVAGDAGSAPVEATLLTGPRDRRPALQTGQPAALPDASTGLRPTVVCRLLIAEDGTVKEAKIYRSRLDLAAFEEAAIDAVQRYRFAPGLRSGKAVPVWINWPVSFK
jgi:TonB family protein